MDRKEREPNFIRLNLDASPQSFPGVSKKRVLRCYGAFRPHSFLNFSGRGIPFRTPLIPVQMGQKSFYSGINVQSPSKSITTIPALPALPAIPLIEVK